jgi:hypothetical protein
MRPDELQTPKAVARVKKPTTYAMMSRSNAKQLLKRREQRRQAVEERRSRRRAIEERRGEREAVRVAKEEALKIVGKVIQKTKARRTTVSTPITKGTRPTQRTRAVVVG